MPETLIFMKNVHKPSTSIKHWSFDDRPREKLMTQGASNLSISELLAILINCGNKDKSAIDLAKEVMLACHQNLNELGKSGIDDLMKVKGIGKARAVTISAALELGLYLLRLNFVLLGIHPLGVRLFDGHTS